MAEGLPPLQNADAPSTRWEEFEPSNKRGHNWTPVYDPQTGDVTAWSRESGGYHEVRDRDGNIIRQDEVPIEESAVQLDDLYPFGELAVVSGKLAASATVAVGAGLLKLALRRGASVTLRQLGKKAIAEWTIADYKLIAGHLIKEVAQREAKLGGKDTLVRLAKIGEQIAPVSDEGARAARLAAKEFNRVLKQLGGGADAQRAAAQAAGDMFHKEIGAAGAQGGADFVTRNALREAKSHYVPFLDALVAGRGKEQVVAYVLKDLVENGAVRRGLVQHFFINPKTGEAVTVVLEATDPALLKELGDLLK